jgi:hypothetical protein
MKIKRLVTALLTVSLTASMVIGTSMTAMAASWQQNATGWWWQEDNGSYPINSWKWINGKCYYFDGNGYMLANTTTPDGYTVDSSGAWVVNGVVQTNGASIGNYDPNYPLKGYVEAFGLLQSPATTRGLWNHSQEAHYDNRRGRMIEYSRTYLVKTLAGETFDATGADEFDYALTAEVKKFLNSFDWRNASDWEKAEKVLERVSQATYTTEANSPYGQDVYYSYGILVNGQGVCDSFSSTFKLLANIIGLECTEYSENMHTYNSYKIDGQWYKMDPTRGAAEAPYSGRYLDWLKNNSTPISEPIIN